MLTPQEDTYHTSLGSFVFKIRTGGTLDNISKLSGIVDLREAPFQIKSGGYLIDHGITTMEQVEQLLEPNYYAIIPLDVLERNDLSANEKLLYAEITALTKKGGECFASNKYLAERLGLSATSMTSIISKLQKKELIIVDIQRNDKGTYRTIKILWSESNVGGGQLKNVGGQVKELGHNRNYNKKLNNYIYKEVLDFFNETFQSGFKSYSFSNNLDYWLETYTIEDIKNAILSAKQDPFWQDKMTPTILFRRKNQNKEDADWIGSLLNKARPKNSLSKYK